MATATVRGGWRRLVPGLVLAATALAAAPGTAADPKGLEGDWEGTLKVPGAELRLAFHVKAAKEGAYKATFDSLDQGATGMPVDAVSLEKGVATFDMKRIGGSFEGKLNAAGTEIVGDWKQGRETFPITFKRTEKATALRRPQTPRGPFPYREERVRIENEAGRVTLAGTFLVPEGKGPFPAVALISGSGAQDRDETILGHKPFLVLADALARRGIAVLRVDDRGVGGSTGNTLTSTTEDLAGDVMNEVAFLKIRPEVDPAKVGLIGHSEGGLIAPIVASRSDDVAFLVMMAGSALPGEDILVSQGKLLAAAEGADARALKLQVELQRKVLDAVKATKDPLAAAAAIRAALKGTFAALPADQKKALGGADQFIEGQVQLAASPWFRFFLTYDPRPTLSKVRCPVLAIVGSKDLQVAPKENLAATARALESGGNRQVTTKELPGLNHLFQTARTGSVSEYGKIEETIAPSALALIGDWVLEQANKSPAPPRR